MQSRIRQIRIITKKKKNIKKNKKKKKKKKKKMANTKDGKENIARGRGRGRIIEIKRRQRKE